MTNGSAVLEKEAAQLRKDAEQLKAKNLKLEASVTWRRLSDEQQKALSAVLLPYAEMIGIAQYNVGDSEQAVSHLILPNPSGQRIGRSLIL